MGTARANMTSVEELLPSVLARLGADDPAGAVVTPLEGGITNQNFRLALGGQEYVLRIGGRNAELLGIDRSREHAASALAASLGIGAEVVFADGSRDLMVTRFIRGSVMTSETAAEPRTLRRLVDSIRRTHEGPEFPGVFSAFDAVRQLHRSAVEHGVSLPTEVAEALSRLTLIEQAIGRPDRPRPCHNDLLPGNFIDDGERIRIIDWEYAAMGDRFFDLGNLAVNLSLNEDSCRALLAEYFGRTHPEDLARVYLMRMASDMREACWGFLQVGLSTLDFDFRAYGMKHLDRFLAHTAAPEFPSLLQQASA